MKFLSKLFSKYKVKSNHLDIYWIPIICAGYVSLFFIMINYANRLPTPLTIKDEEYFFCVFLNIWDMQVTKQVEFLFGNSIFSNLLRFIGLVFCTWLSDNIRVNIFNVSENSTFIAERAYQHVVKLFEMGPKVAGSTECEYIAHTYITTEIRKIIDSSQNKLNIEMKNQVASGAFFIDFKPNPMYSAYQGIQNIAVRLQNAELITESDGFGSVLINTHYDTVPGSPGAGDASTMVAVMLETLRVYSHLIHDMYYYKFIFLFNGAEENLLQGSHGFIEHHEWGNNVVSYINLDSGGIGGREIVFQTTPTNLNVYEKYAKHYFASVIGEELFEANIIPSDSDYRIFRDFGHNRSNIVTDTYTRDGIDMAYISNGYVYHTKYDKLNLLDNGTLQHTGDNLVSLIHPAWENYVRGYFNYERPVYFDIVGTSFVNLGETSVETCNYVASALCLFFIVVHIFGLSKTPDQRKQLLFEFGYLILIQILAIVVAIIFVLLLAYILDASNRSLSWYSQPWLIFGLYYCPVYFGLGIVPALFMALRNMKLPLGHTVQLLLNVQCIIYIAILLILTANGIRSAFLLAISVYCYVPAAILKCFKCFQYRKYWIILHLLATIVPFQIHSYVAYLAYTILVPVQGRSGPDANPDHLIAIVSIGFAMLLGSFIIPLFLLTRFPKSALFSFVLITIVFILISVISHPFKKEIAPQRHWIFHTNRIFHHSNGAIRREENGYFMLPMDRQSTYYIKDYVPEIETALGTENDCKDELMCGLPFYTSRMLGQAIYSSWIPADPPNIHPRPVLMLKDKQTDRNIQKYVFTVEGPTHMGIYISPFDGNRLMQLRIAKDTFDEPIQTIQWGDRHVYFIFFSYALDNRPFEFELIIDKDDATKEYALDIAITGHYTHNNNIRTDSFQTFINSFPDWTHVTSWTSSYEGFVY